MNAILLAGGNSKRMGRDKSRLVYPGISLEEQRIWLFQVLQSAGLEVFVSCRGNPGALPIPTDRILQDSDSESQGPAAGILKAYQARHSPWLVLACDFPFANERAIRELIEHPEAQKGNSVAYEDQDRQIQPLFSFWGIEALEALRLNYANGERSPSKTLANTRVIRIQPGDPKVLANINSPEDLKRYPELTETKPKP